MIINLKSSLFFEKLIEADLNNSHNPQLRYTSFEEFQYNILVQMTN